MYKVLCTIEQTAGILVRSREPKVFPAVLPNHAVSDPAESGALRLKRGESECDDIPTFQLTSRYSLS